MCLGTVTQDPQPPRCPGMVTQDPPLPIVPRIPPVCPPHCPSPWRCRKGRGPPPAAFPEMRKDLGLPAAPPFFFRGGGHTHG